MHLTPDHRYGDTENVCVRVRVRVLRVCKGARVCAPVCVCTPLISSPFPVKISMDKYTRNLRERKNAQEGVETGLGIEQLSSDEMAVSRR